MKKLSSLWLLFLLAILPLRADTTLVFNEIMYHPATNEPAFEWIEFRNLSAHDLDISDWSIHGGVNYTFASNTVVKGGGFIVVAVSPSTLIAATGQTNIVGPFVGRLSNNGESLELRNNSGRTMDSIDYGPDGDWPVAADGAGVSLAKRDPETASRPPENWTISAQIGGTPGVENFPRLPPDVGLTALDTSWKFEASGTDLGTSWRNLNYSDSGWGSRSPFTNQSITTLFNTGVGANRVVLTPGSSDPHYILTAAPQGTVGASALVIQNHSAWLANDTVSSFISVTNPGSLNINDGGYNYQTTFSLDGFIPSTARIDIRVAIDNEMTNVFLNGAATGLSHIGFDALSPAKTVSTGFIPGNNTLEFRTINYSPGANPGGFRAVVSGSGLQANTNNPLPSGNTTYYFRKAFTYTGNPRYTQLRLNAVVADGAVFYLNGVEVRRINMPGGAISASTPASSNVASPDASGTVSISAASLVSGANVLAVEVHQASGSADAPLIGAELTASPLPEPEVTLAFNEQSAGTNSDFWIELVNYGTNRVALDGYTIVQDGKTTNAYTFPITPVSLWLEGGAYMAISNSTTLGFLPVAGDKLYLFAPGGNKVQDSMVVKERPHARFPAGTGKWLFPNQPTPGAANSFAFHNEIVINEIMYHHQVLPPTNNGTLPRQSHENWLELYNKSGTPIDLTGWELDGGISYQFTPGKILQPGAYLVVADDVAALHAAYPGVDIVGNYAGKLSGKGELIALKDPVGNPADEVRYYDGGKWPVYADGGGSSLELRDPNADNSKAEAWAGSDESGKSSWQTYTYRMVANIPAGSGQPTQWNDFILGLQDIGECLVDDISVLESPAGTPVQFITNGDFESGITGWRVLGTHNASRVEVDPTSPGNHVLHVVSTGYQEHMHNHIETTYTGGRAVLNSREYQISFRAKWVAGNNLLNTRLYFNRVGRTTALPTPALNGTPGAQNSRYTPNIGPTFSDFRHSRVIPLPGDPVTVSATAKDPQGVASCTLYWSVNSGPWNNAPMTSQTGGAYTGTIPGYTAGTVVQFYVQAVDGLGASSMYPARGPNSGGLYKVSDGQADLTGAQGHNVRIILTPANIDFMHGVAQGNNQTNVMSNDLLPCTVVYDEQRAYYDVGVHLRGSQRGRYSDVRTGFHMVFQPDDPFMGVHPVMLIDRSGAGDATANRQEEIVLKHILNRAGGIPGGYSQICRLLAPRAAHTGSAQFFPRHEDDMIATAFENGGEGTMYEMELIYYPTTANAAGYKLPQPDNVIGTDLTDLGNDKELYRYNFMIKNNRDRDDYTQFIAMCKALSLTGTALDTQTRQLMDIDECMRGYALVSLCSVGDMYTFGNNHNWFFYIRPSDSKILYFPWDMDFAFSGGASRGLIGDQNFGKMINTIPANKRCLYAHMLDIINISFNSAYMAYWTDHYAKFAPGQSYANSLSTIAARAPFVVSTINSDGGNAAFAVNGSSSITTTNNLVILTGTAPVTMKTIKVNGKEYPIVWTSTSAWRMVIPVSDPTNVLQFVGHDVHDHALTNLAKTVTVNYTGATPDPTDSVLFNEIMYNPATPSTAFVELYNRSTFSFDLSDWRINGLDYTFPKGSVMTNGQYLLLASSLIDYAAAFGTNAPAAFDEFHGNLQNDGETLTLLRPGANPGEEIVVDKVRYESTAPWPTTPNGNGPSLQVIDPTKDNSRVGNWSDGAGWRFFSFTGTPGANATNLQLFLASAGDVYIDNVSIVAGSDPSAGTNYLVNGDFEAGAFGSWKVLGNHSNSVVTSQVAYGGSYSLHIIATGAGGVSALIQQGPFPALPSASPCTLSFWFLPSTNGSGLNFRLTSTYRSITPVSYRPVQATPGTANSVLANIPAFPALWLNEVQPVNLTGITDGQGEREPWVEIYNAGATPISLDGYYLANSYANLAKWAFPAGSSIAPGEFKVIFADNEPGESTASEWHANFRPIAGSGSIALSWSSSGAPQVLDYLNYTNVPANWSYGDYPDGQPFERQALYHPTPGGTNNNAAPPITVSINEWMASNTKTLLNTNGNNRYDDWFELYNPTASPADLDGYYLTDNLLNPTQFHIPPGYVIPAHGLLLVWADNQSNRNSTNDPALHVNFRLANEGEQLGLFASDGSLIDGVTFEPQFGDISQGRYPDGANSIYFLATATPRAANSSWANRYPVLNPIADATALVGEPFSFTASANDPDGNALAFSLDLGAPDGATINPSSGVFSWTPPARSTNIVTVRVTDNGTPALSAARTFTIVAQPGIRVGGIQMSSPGQLAINFNAIIGRTYRIEYKDDLAAGSWTPIPPDVMANSTAMTITIAIGAQSQRFYRLVQVD